MSEWRSGKRDTGLFNVKLLQEREMSKKYNDLRAKSARKPVKVLLNSGKSLKSVKKKASGKEDRAEDDALDHLVLVHFDLSSLIHQIDDLVAEVFKQRVNNKMGKKEIEHFTIVLSEMHSSLKPWIPKFQKALSSPSIDCRNQFKQPLVSPRTPTVSGCTTNAVECADQTMLRSLISSSPLVSWRADYTSEVHRQPSQHAPSPRSKLPSSKRVGPSKSVCEKIFGDSSDEVFKEDNNDNFLKDEKSDDFHDEVTSDDLLIGDLNDDFLRENTNDDFLKGCQENGLCKRDANDDLLKMESDPDPEFVSPPVLSKKNDASVFMTPCLKMSPPKSCILLEPISGVSQEDKFRVRKATPYPLGNENCSSGLLSSKPSSSELSENLGLKYPELVGIKSARKLETGRKEIASPDWGMSPPKSCILMEPHDNKHLNNDLTTISQNDVQGNCCLNLKSCHKGETPMGKESGSTNQTGKLPGENTLKRELWEKFEAASIIGQGLPYNVSAFQDKVAHTGFMERLEEVSGK